jgi:hypothetical protein
MLTKKEARTLFELFTATQSLAWQEGYKARHDRHSMAHNPYGAVTDPTNELLEALRNLVKEAS